MIIPHLSTPKQSIIQQNSTFTNTPTAPSYLQQRFIPQAHKATIGHYTSARYAAYHKLINFKITILCTKLYHKKTGGQTECLSS